LATISFITRNRSLSRTEALRAKSSKTEGAAPLRLSPNGTIKGLSLDSSQNTSHSVDVGRTTVDVAQTSGEEKEQSVGHQLTSQDRELAQRGIVSKNSEVRFALANEGLLDDRGNLTSKSRPSAPTTLMIDES
jgi:hypothetical protein